MPKTKSIVSLEMAAWQGSTHEIRNRVFLCRTPGLETYSCSLLKCWGKKGAEVLQSLRGSSVSSIQDENRNTVSHAALLLTASPAASQLPH